MADVDFVTHRLWSRFVFANYQNYMSTLIILDAKQDYGRLTSFLVLVYSTHHVARCRYAHQRWPQNIPGVKATVCVVFDEKIIILTIVFCRVQLYLASFGGNNAE